jgi:hypothetical protein
MYAYGNELLRSVMQVSLKPLPFGRHWRYRAGPAGSELTEGILQFQLEPAAHLDRQPGLDCGPRALGVPERADVKPSADGRTAYLQGNRAAGEIELLAGPLQQDLEAGVVQRRPKDVRDLLGFGAAVADLPGELLDLGQRQCAVPVSQPGCRNATSVRGAAGLARWRWSSR